MENNFDQSSTGVNLTLDVSRDSGVAYWRWSDFLMGYTLEGGSEVTPYRHKDGSLHGVVIMDNPSAPYYERSLLEKAKKDILAILWNGYYGRSSTLADYTKDEIILELMNITVKDYYDHAYSEHDGFYGVPHDFVTRGYSQGDVVLVKVHTKDPTKFAHITEKYMTQLLWEEPIYFKFTAELHDGTTYEVHGGDALDDEYEWSAEVRQGLIDGIVEGLKKDEAFAGRVDYIAEWLQSNVPVFV